MIMLNNNLRIFITVAEQGSITETAKKLYVSQPAISHAVKKLEEELGVRLFDRNKRGRLMLTDVGQEVLSLANQMASLENRLYQTAYEENHLMRGVVRIATIPIGASLILSHTFPAFKKQYPDVTIELLEGNPREVKDMVLNYRADLGITTSPYMDMEHRLLMTDRMVSINSRKPVRIDLRRNIKPLILCKMAYENITEQLLGEKIDLSDSLMVQEASTQINIVANGSETGIISELMLSSISNTLYKGTIVPEISMDISLVANRFSELSVSGSAMADMILKN